jgi:hypothetical protein
MWAWVLAQVDPEGQSVVTYFSITFNTSTANLILFLALVESIKHFKYYLCDLPFTVITNH